nr:hypothetical protein BaRGS_019579 [Batillaria attramentaria]
MSGIIPNDSTSVDVARARFSAELQQEDERGSAPSSRNNSGNISGLSDVKGFDGVLCNQLVTTVWFLQDERGPHILEIGVGPGNNHTHFPRPSRMSCIEPNSECKKYLEQNLRETRAWSVLSVRSSVY